MWHPIFTFSSGVAVAVPPASTGANLFRGLELPVGLRLAQVRGFVDEDLFGKLTADRGDDDVAAVAPGPARGVAARALEEADEFAVLTARSVYEAACRPLHGKDDFARLSARRGLPPREWLAWWMNNAT